MRRIVYYTIKEFVQNWCLVSGGNNASFITSAIEAFFCSFFGIGLIINLPISIKDIYYQVKNDPCEIDGEYKKEIPVLCFFSH
ncbi:MAG: hypothetical protein ABIG60_03345 [Patescibacteria group bacterium]